LAWTGRIPKFRKCRSKMAGQPNDKTRRMTIRRVFILWICPSMGAEWIPALASLVFVMPAPALVENFNSRAIRELKWECSEGALSGHPQSPWQGVGMRVGCCGSPLRARGDDRFGRAGMRGLIRAGLVCYRVPRRNRASSKVNPNLRAPPARENLASENR
jgi:hypothetical protein